METMVNLCNKDNTYVFVVLLSIQQLIVHPVINYMWCSESVQEFFSVAVEVTTTITTYKAFTDNRPWKKLFG